MIMAEHKIKLWMPVAKDKTTGELSAVLSDTSLDRDEEAMSKSLIRHFGNYQSLKALANHTNKMEAWVGGWTDLKVVEKGNNAALFAKPWFFSKDANPLSYQIQKQVEEALKKGENPGISIGAIVHDSETRKVNGKDVRVFTKGELLEATWVPIQSNRNASYGHIAKKFETEEDNTMSKTYTEEEFSEVSKKVEGLEKEKSEVEKKLDDVSKEKEDLEKEFSEYKESVEKKQKDEEEEKKALSEELETRYCS